MNHCQIVIYRKSTRLVSYTAEVTPDGGKAKLKLNAKQAVLCEAFMGKPALKVAMERIILHFDGYNPQTDRVTIEPEEDLGF